MSETSAIAVHIEGLLENSGDAFFILNAERRIVFFNKACERLTGVNAAKALGLECRPHEGLAPPELAELAIALHPPAELWKNQTASCPAAFLQADGRREWYSVLFIPCQAADGSLAAILGRIGPAELEPTLAVTPEPLRQALARLRHSLAQRFNIDHIVAASPAMQRVLTQLRLASQTRTCVLFRGERGVGKEGLARTIHQQSADRQRSFVALEVAVLPPNLLDRQLSENGLLGPTASPTGTLYLKDVAFLPRDLQVRLVGYLDQHAAEPKLRVMAGTTSDLVEACRGGTMLEALYYRLSVFVIDVPPLRERKLDLPLLTQQVLERFNLEGEKAITQLHASAQEIVEQYGWPDNFLEFNAVLMEAFGRAKHAEVQARDFPLHVRSAVDLAQLPAPTPLKPLPLEELLTGAERRIIQLALRDARGNKSKAAGRLKVSRARLYRRMQMLGIEDVEGDTPPAAELVEDEKIQEASG